MNLGARGLRTRFVLAIALAAGGVGVGFAALFAGLTIFTLLLFLVAYVAAIVVGIMYAGAEVIWPAQTSVRRRKARLAMLVLLSSGVAVVVVASGVESHVDAASFLMPMLALLPLYLPRRVVRRARSFADPPPGSPPAQGIS